MKSLIKGIILFSGVSVLSASAGDLTLREAQKMLFDSSRAIRIKEKQLDIRAVRIRNASAQFHPEIDAGFNYMLYSKNRRMRMEMEIENPLMPGNALDIDETNEIGDRDVSDLYWRIKYPLFTSLSRVNRYKSEKVLKDKTVSELEKKRQDLSLKLGKLFFAWSFLDQKKELYQTRVQELSENAARVLNLKKEGMATETMLLSARSKLEMERVKMTEAEIAADTMRIKIGNLISEGLPGSRPVQYNITQVSNGRSIKQVSQDPEIHETEAMNATLKSLRLKKKALKGKRFPSLFVSAEGHIANPGLNLNIDEWQTYGVFGLNAVWNIYDGFRNRGERDLIEHRISIIELNREMIKQEYAARDSVARRKLRNAERLKHGAEVSLKAAEEYKRTSKLRFVKGQTSQKEYLEAVTRKSEAEVMLKRAEMLYNQAYIEILYANDIPLEY